MALLKQFLDLPPHRAGWVHAIILTVALLPFYAIALHATPQVFDFCMGRFLHDGFWQGLVNQFNIYGHQFMGRTLGVIPITIVSWLAIDYFYLYALFSVLALTAFVWLSRRVVAELLPTAPMALHVFGAALLTFALVGNAPSARALVFSLPGFFTFALPGLVMALIFIVLYHSLAASRAMGWQEHMIVLLGTCFAALSNEWSGIALIGLFLCSFIARLKLVPDAPEPITHAAAICLGLFGAILILFGPSDPVFNLQHIGEGVAWSAYFTPEFFILRLPLPGIAAWFLFLAFSYRPELRGSTLSVRHRQLAAFAFFSLFIMAFIAFMFGYMPDETRLRARAQNQLFIVVLVALSILFCLVVPVVRFRLAPRIQHYTPWLTRVPLLPAIIVLALLSPAWLASIVQIGEAGDFRAEQRARFALLINRAEPTVFLPPINARPSLLFDEEIGNDTNSWRNSCVADFFKVDKVLPQPGNL